MTCFARVPALNGRCTLYARPRGATALWMFASSRSIFCCSGRHGQVAAELAAIDAAPALLKAGGQLRRDALKLLEDWRGLLGSNVAVSRSAAAQAAGPRAAHVLPEAGQGCRLVRGRRDADARPVLRWTAVDQKSR